jgi:CheY-like chemotaxis protein
MWRVLVVDDERAIRELLRAVLELEGYQVLTAGDGAEAVELLESAEAPWIVLLDVMMPRLGGLEVCERLQLAGAERARHTVALMTAGLLSAEECPAPARALLRKPFNLDEVVRLVARLAGELKSMEVAPLASAAQCGAGMPAAG